MARNARLPLQPLSEGAESARGKLKRLRRASPTFRDVRAVRITLQARRADSDPEPSPPGTEHGKQRGATSVEPLLRDQILGLLPNLRAFALFLANDPTRADDLVQETILRAWAKIDHFERGTNLEAWLFTILRHSFFSAYRKRKREVEDPEGKYAKSLRIQPEQETCLLMSDLRRALVRLPPEQREALILVGVRGITYESAAAICGVAVGTIKSRVNRARDRLAHMLQVEDRRDLGPDRLMKAALQEHAAAGR